MKKIIFAGASALAVLGGVSFANAQSISETIGEGLLDLQGQFEGGNWVNEALNIEAIDGSVVLRGTGLTGAVDVDLGSINLDADLIIEASLAAGLDLDVILDLIAGGDISGLLALGLAAGVDLSVALGIDNGSFAGNLTTGGSIISQDVIETLAAGAVNTGDIASQIATSTTETGTNFEFSFEGGSFSDINEASSSASTSTTSAAASVVDNTELQVGAISAAFSEYENISTSGPLTGIYASNRAFNSAEINGSVTAVANSIDLNGIGTTAAGAINTGTISLGFDGSAFGDLN